MKQGYDRKPCPFHIVHLPLDGADCRRAGRTQKIEHQEGISRNLTEVCTNLRPAAMQSRRRLRPQPWR